MTSRRRLRVIRPDRPVTRGDCEGGPRPCVFVGCRFNLSIEIAKNEKRVIVRFPDADGDPDLAAQPDNCALDWADSGPSALEDIGRAIGTTRQYVEQVLKPVMRDDAIVRLAMVYGPEPFAEPVPEARMPRITR